MWDLLQSGIKPVSPALAGGFFITEPPGKPWSFLVYFLSTDKKKIHAYHRLHWHGFGWTPGIGDGQGGLACCGSWGCKELDTTERLNWTEHTEIIFSWPYLCHKILHLLTLIDVWFPIIKDMEISYIINLFPFASHFWCCVISSFLYGMYLLFCHSFYIYFSLDISLVKILPLAFCSHFLKIYIWLNILHFSHKAYKNNISWILSQHPHMVFLLEGH